MAPVSTGTAIFVYSLLLLLNLLNANVAEAQPLALGVSHDISVDLGVDESLPDRVAVDSSFSAELRVTLQISDHAPDSDFYGVVVADFALAPGQVKAPELTVWQDQKCHRDRGLPKVTVTAIDGTMHQAGGSATIAAAARRLGLRLPKDEIIVHKQTAVARLGAGLFALLAKTSSSGLLTRIAVHARPCRLGG